jgi:hypothetical protein
MMALLIFRRNFSAEMIAFNGFGIVTMPPAFPVGAAEWFALLQERSLLGLILLDLVDLINYALIGLFFLALYGALRKTNPGMVLLATVCAVVGIGVYFASNQAFGLLTLSHQYALAGTDAQRQTLLAAGETLLAVHGTDGIHRGTGMYASLFLVLVAGLLFSMVMLRSGIFGKVSAIIGIAANIVALLYFAAIIFAPALLVIPFVVSAPLRITWYFLSALTLFRLSSAAYRPGKP